MAIESPKGKRVIVDVLTGESVETVEGYEAVIDNANHAPQQETTTE